MDSVLRNTVIRKKRMSTFPSPLPLAAFEEYMVRDDRPTYPMSIVARLRFTGHLDRRTCRSSGDGCRTPSSPASHDSQDRGRTTRMDRVPDRPLAISWTDSAQDDRLPLMRPIDLFSEPGLRVWATADSQCSSLVWQFHHAACDGKAVLQVLDDFARNYALAVDCKDTRIELSACDAEALRGRGRFGLSVGKYLRMLPAQLTGLWGVRQFLMRRPVPLLELVSAISQELPSSFPDVKVGRLEAEDMRKLAAMVADSNVTVNDLLLRDFFVAIDDFRARHQAIGSGDWIRFSVPINLRQATDCCMSAANVVSMIFLDRTPAQIADPSRLLESIHAEMDLIRRHHLGLTFVLTLSVLRLLPGGLAKWVNHDRCEATCVLSNVGRVMADSPLPRRNNKIVAGNVVLEGVDFFTPVRNGTAVAVAFLFYAGGLQICMQYDARCITEVQASDLMATYLRKIRDSIDMASRTGHGKAA